MSRLVSLLHKLIQGSSVDDKCLPPGTDIAGTPYAACSCDADDPAPCSEALAARRGGRSLTAAIAWRLNSGMPSRPRVAVRLR